MKDDRVTQACWLVLTTRARPPVHSEVGLPRLAHIAKGAMYAPPEAGLGCASAQPLGTKPECGLESTVSLFGISLQHRRLGARWVAHTWRCLPWVRPEIVAEAGRRCGPTLITHDLNELPAL